MQNGKYETQTCSRVRLLTLLRLSSVAPDANLAAKNVHILPPLSMLFINNTTLARCYAWRFRCGCERGATYRMTLN